mmetsp:Transcript_9831/g.18503  ORF Transcript_9831/g.18503 Transcript_9831/m.18503 type:complete len:268 (-) Transcript_9831:684-1487(-)
MDYITIEDSCVSRTKSTLRRIYILVTCLCIFMFVWITIAPATAFVNRQNPGWRDHLRSRTNQQINVLPRGLLTKYEGETLVACTHILPAVFWIMAIPVQFHPMVRKKYRAFHRFIGRAFVLTSFILMIGFVVILQRGLSFENYLEGVEPVVIPGTQLSYGDAFLYLMASFFLYFAIRAVMSAKSRDFQSHQYWMIRHCSCGLWVIIQRILAIVAAGLYNLIYGNLPAPEHIRGKVFFDLGLVAILLSVGIGEYTIDLLKTEGKRKAL